MFVNTRLPQCLMMAAAFLAFGLQAPKLQANVLLAEADFAGDYSNDGLNPSDLGTLLPGANTFTASFGGSFATSFDEDVVTFTVPDGYQLAELRLTSFSVTGGSDGNGSFFGIAAGPKIGATAGDLDDYPHLGNGLYDETDLGDLLPEMIGQYYVGYSGPKPTASIPLPAGDYSLLLSEFNGGFPDASFDLVVTAVPEPASILILAAAGGLGLLRRSRRPRSSFSQTGQEPEPYSHLA